MPFLLDKSCISLEKHSKPYYSPGDTVSGKVSLITDKPLSVRFIKISWAGEMTTSLPELSEPHTKTFFARSKVVWQSQDGMNVLPIGKHVFSFLFKLPEDCEPSFYGAFGAIHYSIRVEVNRPWIKRDLAVDKTIFVTRQYNVKEKAADMFLGARFGNHRVAGTIFKDGQFSMKISLPTRAFTPGETIFATVSIDNASSKPIRSIQAQLIQQSHYHHRPTHSCGISECRSCPLDSKNRAEAEKVLQSVDFGYEIAPFSRKSFNVKIDVPVNITPIFENSMISIGYLLSFKAKNGSLSGNKLECNARIAIGSRVEKPKIQAPPPPYQKEWTKFE